jgi:uncharacterized membrane protein
LLYKKSAFFFANSLFSKGDINMAKKQLVLAFFESEAAADEAANQVQQWDKANKDIKLGAIGVLVKDDKGKVKTHKLGRRHTGVGAVLGAIAGAVSGGFTMVTGFIVGSIMGFFYRQGLGMSKDDIARIGSELDGGKAAVGVLVEAEEGPEVTTKLAELGGKPETHEVSEEALEQVQEAAEAMPEEPAEA